MSFKKRLYIYVILSFISMGIVNARSITIQQTIDWPEFMSSQDMIWKYCLNIGTNQPIWEMAGWV